MVVFNVRRKEKIEDMRRPLNDCSFNDSFSDIFAYSAIKSVLHEINIEVCI